MGLLTVRPSSAKFAAEDPCFLDVDEYPEWQSQFGNSQPIKLEIGFGMGDFLIEMATREPHSNFVGIDFSQNGIRKIMARIKNLQLNNIRVVYGDVREKIPLLFENGELDTVYINFPDPWPRKRHFKRRLIKPALVKLIARKLAPAGHVYLATDSEPYALEILEYFNAEPLLQNVNPESGFFADRDHLPKTKYEKSFIYAGDKIHYLEYSRLVDDGQVEKPTEKAASTFAEAEAINNDERLTKNFKDAEAKAKAACDLKQVADNLADAGDKQWAKKVYRKAEDKAEDSLDLNWLAYSISVALGDKEWARQLYKKAEDKAQDSSDLHSLVECICGKLDDKEWAKKVYRKAESLAQDSGDFCGLADSLCKNLGDEEWVIRLYKIAEGKGEESYEFLWLADSLYEKLGDKEWAKKLYKKAEEKAEAFYEFRWLAESLSKNLDDKEWSEKVYKKASAH